MNKATVSKWMEETTRAQIKKAYEEDNFQVDRKKLRVSKYRELEMSVFDWFNDKRATHPEV